MKYSIIFSPEAQEDIVESIQWYNNGKENLGFEFYQAAEDKLTKLRRHLFIFQGDSKLYTYLKSTDSLISFILELTKRISYSNFGCITHQSQSFYIKKRK